MDGKAEFDRMADRCIEAGQAVMSHGTADLQAAMRILLTVLGREIALRDGSPARTDDKRYGAARLSH